MNISCVTIAFYLNGGSDNAITSEEKEVILIAFIVITGLNFICTVILVVQTKRGTDLLTGTTPRKALGTRAFE